jgi:hypothetical protein
MSKGGDKSILSKSIKK